MNKGFASIVMIFLLLFVAVITQTIHLYTQKILKMQAEEVRSLRLKNETKNKVLQDSGKSLASVCSNKAQNRSGDVVIKRELTSLCSSYRGGHLGIGLINKMDLKNGAYPFFNYGKIFSEVDDCDFEDDEPPIDLTPTAFRSARLCKMVLGDLIIERKVLKGNLKAANIIFIRPAIIHENLLASSGYIYIDRLVLAAPTIIVAGGDVKIGKLIVTSKLLPEVTIISASGSITISEVSGSARFFVIAWAGSVLPSEILLVKTTLLPEQLAWIPFSSLVQ